MKRAAISPSLLNHLARQGEELRVLLVASNTEPFIPGVDEEIRSLETFLRQVFEEKGFSVNVKTIFSDQATYETMREELSESKYHIFHYAGHGFYDPQSPEQSCLFFWEQNNCKGAVRKLSVSEMNILLGGSNLQFVYLSCCLGGHTGDKTHLLDDDFLGIADGMIQAGVPAVLGFRWPVSDSSAKELALAFYSSLANQGQLDVALFHARRLIASRDRDDITWISPVLIIH
jgi:CHAT domain-containing protein